ncbi:MAG: hypothetical protein ACKOQ3_13085, partial [Novosphingobium sp.]
MSALRTAIAALAAFALAPLAVHAQAVEEKNLLSGKARLDPAQGYLFVQGANRSQGVFLRVPDDSTRAEYQKDWDEGFAKAKKKYASAIKTWEKDVAIARQTKSKLPTKPEEPTRETFSIGAIELRDMVSFGPMFVFAKSETQFTYLTAVKPGTYIYYGPMYYAPNLAPAGQCYCMGTVRFEVKGGVITDLGNALAALPQLTPPYSVGTQAMLAQNEERKAKGKDPLWTPPALAYGVPASLKALPAVQAELHASGKLNNHFGLPIDRMPPIPGVLGYRRDTVLDLRTG